MFECVHWLFFHAGVEVVKQFMGDGFVVSTPQLKTIKMPWSKQISFRTREQFGLLMVTVVGRDTNSIIEVRIF